MLPLFALPDQHLRDESRVFHLAELPPAGSARPLHASVHIRTLWGDDEQGDFEPRAGRFELVREFRAAID
jgi:hypothetical protein